MKKLALITLALLLSFAINAQDYPNQEVICPCMLEFDFPKSMEDGQGLLAAFGGVPVLRFAEAKINGQKLICVYDKNFAKFFFEGFGYARSDGTYGDIKDIPYDLTLTLKEDFLHGWTPNRQTLKLPNYHRGCVVYTLDHCDDINKYAWNGGFFSSRYNGNQVTLYRSFEGVARVNNTETGFIIAKSMNNLFNTTTAINPEVDNVERPKVILKKDTKVLDKRVLPNKRKNLSKEEIELIKNKKELLNKEIQEIKKNSGKKLTKEEIELIKKKKAQTKKEIEEIKKKKENELL